MSFCSAWFCHNFDEVPEERNSYLQRLAWGEMAFVPGDSTAAPRASVRFSEAFLWRSVAAPDVAPALPQHPPGARVASFYCCLLSSDFPEIGTVFVLFYVWSLNG